MHLNMHCIQYIQSTYIILYQYSVRPYCFVLFQNYFKRYLYARVFYIRTICIPCLPQEFWQSLCGLSIRFERYQYVSKNRDSYGFAINYKIYYDVNTAPPITTLSYNTQKYNTIWYNGKSWNRRFFSITTACMCTYEFLGISKNSYDRVYSIYLHAETNSQTARAWHE